MPGQTRRDLLLAALTVGAAVASQVDDITDLLTASPRGMAQQMSYRQGVIITFDKTTLENTVEVGGSLVTNLPVLGVAEAASLSAGSVVGLMVVGSTWAIIGRLVQPGTGDATDAITQVSQRIYTGTNLSGATTSSTTWSDIPNGPELNAVLVGASGRLLVLVGASLNFITSIGSGRGGWVSIRVSGATTVAASEDYGVEFQLFPPLPASGDIGGTSRQSYASVVEGLTPGGSHTLTAVMKATNPGENCNINQINVTAFAF